MSRRTWLLPVIVFVLPLLLAADSSAPRIVAQGEGGKPDKKAGRAKDADKPADKLADKAAGGKAKPHPPITPEREAAVMAFVRQHHAELGELLVRLKASNSQEYERAIRDLSRTSERLAQIRKNDTDRFELELKLWQAQSHSDLLTARLTMTGSDELRSQLQQILNEQMDLKQLLLQLDRQRTADKLQKLDEQLNAFDQTRQDAIERQLRSLTGDKSNSIPNAKPNAKTKDKK